MALQENVIELQVGQKLSRNALLRKLVQSLYVRNDLDLQRGNFRVKGDTVDIAMAYSEVVLRITFWDDEIDAIEELDGVTFDRLAKFQDYKLYPANLFMTSQEQTNIASHCSGIENYSRYFDGRKAGERPYCLLDFFPDDYLLFIDESHVSVPQINGMYGGDRSRKQNLVEYGFRLPAAFDNRPLRFEEFQQEVHQVIYVSATPADFELQEAEGIVVEQVIRPTGLLDPEIEVRPSENQIDDLLNEIQIRKERGERVLVTTLTKRMAEEMADYLMRHGVRTNYIHSEVKTLERVQILNDLRLGNYDVLVGVNLLREGLDLPEVSLVAILDADKEGFLRSHRSLTQTAGRAARNVNGKVIMYADTITASMQLTIDETLRRREKQIRYNEEHGITPKQIVKNISQAALQKENRADTKELRREYGLAADGMSMAADPIVARMTRPQMEKYIAEIQQQMKEAAKRLDFLQAAQYRDEIIRLQRELELK